jgi:hypothetical protein
VRKQEAAEKKKRYIEITSDLYNLVMNSNKMVQGKYLT